MSKKLKHSWLWIALYGFLFVAVPSILLALHTPSAQGQTQCYTPSGDSRFGVVAHLGWRFLYPPDDMARALDMMVDAGIGWVRLNWAWKDLQPVEGPFDYSHYDAIARLASERGILLLPILAAVPAWASTAPDELKAVRGNLSPVDRYRPYDWDDWLRYVHNVVERYDGDGVDDAPGSPRLSHWEVWNEPNLAAFWPPEPDVGEYVALLVATHDTIKAADPTATVVLGGLAGAGVTSEGSGYLGAVYDAGGAPYFDVVSVHVYIHPTRGTIAQLQEVLATARRLMDANGDADKPLWLTEIGWSDAPGAWGGPTATPDEVAAFLTQVYTAPLAADVIFWYNFRNIFDGSSDVEHNFGLVRANLTPKPAYEAYAAVTAACR